MSDFTLSDLARIIAARRAASAQASYTKSLLDKGMDKCAQKLGEEAVETVIAALCGDHDKLKAETADLLYHLLVVLEAGGVAIADVMAELERRTAQSGHAEKAARG